MNRNQETISSPIWNGYFPLKLCCRQSQYDLYCSLLRLALSKNISPQKGALLFPDSSGLDLEAPEYNLENSLGGATVHAKLYQEKGGENCPIYIANIQYGSGNR
jgi:hypothetical protein